MLKFIRKDIFLAPAEETLKHRLISKKLQQDLIVYKCRSGSSKDLAILVSFLVTGCMGLIIEWMITVYHILCGATWETSRRAINFFYISDPTIAGYKNSSQRTCGGYISAVEGLVQGSNWPLGTRDLRPSEPKTNALSPEPPLMLSCWLKKA